MELFPLLVPAGSDTEVQFNDGNLFGADSTFTFNDTTKIVDMDGLTITGTTAIGLDMSGGTFATAIQKWPAGTIQTVGDLSVNVNTINRMKLDDTGLTINSADATDSITMYHDNDHAWFKWNDGRLYLETDEGTNANAEVFVRGKGTGYGDLRAYDQDNAEYFQIRAIDGYAQLRVDGVSPQGLRLQSPANVPIFMFTDATEGETQYLAITGFKTGDAARTLTGGISSTYDDTFEFDGVSNYRFDGQVEAEIAGTAGVVDVFKASAIGNKGADRGVALIFHPPDASSATLGGRIACNREGATLDTYLSFQTHDGAAMGERVRITSDGILKCYDGAQLGDGGTTNYVQIDSDGDTRFLGGAGLPFGSCYGNEIAWTQASAVQNTWYEISDADMANGQLHDVAHDGNGKLTVTYAGMYLCNYAISGETDAGAGTHIQCTFSVSGTETNDGMNHSETIGANSQIAMSGVAILDLAASATLEVSIRTTDAGTPDISVDHLNITCVQIGGT
jgi:hypothetical protein